MLCTFCLQEVSSALTASDSGRAAAAPAAPPVRLPASVALLEDFSSAGPEAPLVIFLQDAHTNPSAQLNIARALEQILKDRTITTVYLEAGKGDVSLTDLKDSIPSDARRTVGLSHLKKGLLQGVEYANLTLETSFSLWGVENRALYERALRVYRGAAAGRERSLVAWTKIEAAHAAVREATFGPDLLEWDSAARDYYAGELPPVKFAALIEKRLSGLGLPDHFYPKIKSLTKLNENESVFKEALVQEGMRELARAALGPEGLKDPAERILVEEFESGKERDEARVDAVCDLLLQVAVRQDLATLTPEGREAVREAEAFMRHRVQVRELVTADLVAEIETAAEAVALRLASGDEDRRMLEAGKMIGLWKSALELRLDSKGYQLLKAAPGRLTPAGVQGYLNRRISGLGRYYEKALWRDHGFERALKAVMSFYELAERRDRIFWGLMRRRMNESGEKRAVLVTGGYHADHLKRIFRSSGVSYVSFVPRVAHETDSAKYEKILLSRVRRSSGTPASTPDPVRAAINTLQVRAAGNSAARSAFERDLQQAARMAAVADRGLPAGPEKAAVVPGLERIVAFWRWLTDRFHRAAFGVLEFRLAYHRMRWIGASPEVVGMILENRIGRDYREGRVKWLDDELGRWLDKRGRTPNEMFRPNYNDDFALAAVHTIRQLKIGSFKSRLMALMSDPATVKGSELFYALRRAIRALDPAGAERLFSDQAGAPSGARMSYHEMNNQELAAEARRQMVLREEEPDYLWFAVRIQDIIGSYGYLVRLRSGWDPDAPLRSYLDRRPLIGLLNRWDLNIQSRREGRGGVAARDEALFDQEDDGPAELPDRVTARKSHRLAAEVLAALPDQQWRVLSPLFEEIRSPLSAHEISDLDLVRKTGGRLREAVGVWDQMESDGDRPVSRRSAQFQRISTLLQEAMDAAEAALDGIDASQDGARMADPGTGALDIDRPVFWREGLKALKDASVPILWILDNSGTMTPSYETPLRADMVRKIDTLLESSRESHIVIASGDPLSALKKLYARWLAHPRFTIVAEGGTVVWTGDRGERRLEAWPRETRRAYARAMIAGLEEILPGLAEEAAAAVPSGRPKAGSKDLLKFFRAQLDAAAARIDRAYADGADFDEIPLIRHEDTVGVVAFADQRAKVTIHNHTRVMSEGLAARLLDAAERHLAAQATPGTAPQLPSYRAYGSGYIDWVQRSKAQGVEDALDGAAGAGRMNAVLPRLRAEDGTVLVIAAGDSSNDYPTFRLRFRGLPNAIYLPIFLNGDRRHAAHLAKGTVVPLAFRRPGASGPDAMREVMAAAASPKRADRLGGFVWSSPFETPYFTYRLRARGTAGVDPSNLAGSAFSKLSALRARLERLDADELGGEEWERIVRDLREHADGMRSRIDWSPGQAGRHRRAAEVRDRVMRDRRASESTLVRKVQSGEWGEVRTIAGRLVRLNALLMTLQIRIALMFLDPQAADGIRSNGRWTHRHYAALASLRGALTSLDKMRDSIRLAGLAESERELGRAYPVLDTSGRVSWLTLPEAFSIKRVEPSDAFAAERLIAVTSRNQIRIPSTLKRLAAAASVSDADTVIRVLKQMEDALDVRGPMTGLTGANRSGAQRVVREIRSALLDGGDPRTVAKDDTRWAGWSDRLKAFVGGGFLETFVTVNMDPWAVLRRYTSHMPHAMLAETRRLGGWMGLTVLLGSMLDEWQELSSAERSYVLKSIASMGEWASRGRVDERGRIRSEAANFLQTAFERQLEPEPASDDPAAAHQQWFEDAWRAADAWSARSGRDGLPKAALGRMSSSLDSIRRQIGRRATAQRRIRGNVRLQAQAAFSELHIQESLNRSTRLLRALEKRLSSPNTAERPIDLRAFRRELRRVLDAARADLEGVAAETVGSRPLMVPGLSRGVAILEEADRMIEHHQTRIGSGQISRGETNTFLRNRVLTRLVTFQQDLLHPHAARVRLDIRDGGSRKTSVLYVEPASAEGKVAVRGILADQGLDPEAWQVRRAGLTGGGLQADSVFGAQEAVLDLVVTRAGARLSSRDWSRTLWTDAARSGRSVLLPVLQWVAGAGLTAAAHVSGWVTAAGLLPAAVGVWSFLHRSSFAAAIETLGSAAELWRYDPARFVHETWVPTAIVIAAAAYGISRVSRSAWRQAARAGWWGLLTVVAADRYFSESARLVDAASRTVFFAVAAGGLVTLSVHLRRISIEIGRDLRADAGRRLRDRLVGASGPVVIAESGVGAFEDDLRQVFPEEDQEEVGDEAEGADGGSEGPAADTLTQTAPAELRRQALRQLDIYRRAGVRRHEAARRTVWSSIDRLWDRYARLQPLETRDAFRTEAFLRWNGSLEALKRRLEAEGPSDEEVLWSGLLGSVDFWLGNDRSRAQRVWEYVAGRPHSREYLRLARTLEALDGTTGARMAKNRFRPKPAEIWMKRAAWIMPVLALIFALIYRSLPDEDPADPAGSKLSSEARVLSDEALLRKIQGEPLTPADLDPAHARAGTSNLITTLIKLDHDPESLAILLRRERVEWDAVKDLFAQLEVIRDESPVQELAGRVREKFQRLYPDTLLGLLAGLREIRYMSPQQMEDKPRMDGYLDRIRAFYRLESSGAPAFPGSAVAGRYLKRLTEFGFDPAVSNIASIHLYGGRPSGLEGFSKANQRVLLLHLAGKGDVDEKLLGAFLGTRPLTGTAGRQSSDLHGNAVLGLRSILALFDEGSQRDPMARQKVREGMVRHAELLVRRINDLHDQPAAVRYELIDDFTPRELYHLISNSDAELYTSTYHHLMDRLMSGLAQNGGSIESLLRADDWEGFESFAALAAGFRRLPEVLNSYQRIGSREDRQRFVAAVLVKLFEGGFDDAAGNGRAVALARILESKDDAGIFPLLIEKLRAGYDSAVSAGNRTDRIHFGLLAGLASKRVQAPDPWLDSMAREYPVRTQDRVAEKELFGGSGKHYVAVYFPDDTDGKASFDHFVLKYQASGWSRSPVSASTPASIAVFSSKKQNGRQVILVANDPRSLEGSGARDLYLKRNARGDSGLGIFFRGHSFNQGDNRREAVTGLGPEAARVRLAFIGACGGIRNQYDLVRYFGSADFVGTVGTGTMQMNETLSQAIFQEMLDRGSVDWADFFKRADRRFMNDPDYDGYRPKGITPIDLIRAFERAEQASRPRAAGGARMSAPETSPAKWAMTLSPMTIGEVRALFEKPSAMDLAGEIAVSLLQRTEDYIARINELDDPALSAGFLQELSIAGKGIGEQMEALRRDPGDLSRAILVETLTIGGVIPEWDTKNKALSLKGWSDMALTMGLGDQEKTEIRQALMSLAWIHRSLGRYAQTGNATLETFMSGSQPTGYLALPRPTDAGARMSSRRPPMGGSNAVRGAVEVLTAAVFTVPAIAGMILAAAFGSGWARRRLLGSGMPGWYRLGMTGILMFLSGFPGMPKGLMAKVSGPERAPQGAGVPMALPARRRGDSPEDQGAASLRSDILESAVNFGEAVEASVQHDLMSNEVMLTHHSQLLLADQLQLGPSHKVLGYYHEMGSGFGAFMLGAALRGASADMVQPISGIDYINWMPMIDFYLKDIAVRDFSPELWTGVLSRLRSIDSRWGGEEWTGELRGPYTHIYLPLMQPYVSGAVLKQLLPALADEATVIVVGDGGSFDPEMAWQRTIFEINESSSEFVYQIHQQGRTSIRYGTIGIGQKTHVFRIVRRPRADFETTGLPGAAQIAEIRQMERVVQLLSKDGRKWSWDDQGHEQEAAGRFETTRAVFAAEGAYEEASDDQDPAKRSIRMRPYRSGDEPRLFRYGINTMTALQTLETALEEIGNIPYIGVDVGAGSGALTLRMAADLPPGGKIYAVEPDEAALKELGHNLWLNGVDHSVVRSAEGMSEAANDPEVQVIVVPGDMEHFDRLAGESGWATIFPEDRPILFTANMPVAAMSRVVPLIKRRITDPTSPLLDRDVRLHLSGMEMSPRVGGTYFIGSGSDGTDLESQLMRADPMRWVESYFDGPAFRGRGWFRMATPEGRRSRSQVVTALIRRTPQPGLGGADGARMADADPEKGLIRRLMSPGDSRQALNEIGRYIGESAAEGPAREERLIRGLHKALLEPVSDRVRSVEPLAGDAIPFERWRAFERIFNSRLNPEVLEFLSGMPMAGRRQVSRSDLRRAILRSLIEDHRLYPSAASDGLLKKRLLEAYLRQTGDRRIWIRDFLSSADQTGESGLPQITLQNASQVGALDRFVVSAGGPRVHEETIEIPSASLSSSDKKVAVGEHLRAIRWPNAASVEFKLERFISRGANVIVVPMAAAPDDHVHPYLRGREVFVIREVADPSEFTSTAILGRVPPQAYWFRSAGQSAEEYARLLARAVLDRNGLEKPSETIILADPAALGPAREWAAGQLADTPGGIRELLRQVHAVRFIEDVPSDGARMAADPPRTYVAGADLKRLVALALKKHGAFLENKDRKDLLEAADYAFQAVDQAVATGPLGNEQQVRSLIPIFSAWSVHHPVFEPVGIALRAWSMKQGPQEWESVAATLEPIKEYQRKMTELLIELNSVSAGAAPLSAYVAVAEALAQVGDAIAASQVKPSWSLFSTNRPASPGEPVITGVALSNEEASHRIRASWHADFGKVIENAHVRWAAKSDRRYVDAAPLVSYEEMRRWHDLWQEIPKDRMMKEGPLFKRVSWSHWWGNFRNIWMKLESQLPEPVGPGFAPVPARPAPAESRPAAGTIQDKGPASRRPVSEMNASASAQSYPDMLQDRIQRDTGLSQELANDVRRAFLKSYFWSTQDPGTMDAVVGQLTEWYAALKSRSLDQLSPASGLLNTEADRLNSAADEAVFLAELIDEAGFAVQDEKVRGFLTEMERSRITQIVADLGRKLQVMTEASRTLTDQQAAPDRSSLMAPLRKRELMALLALAYARRLVRMPANSADALQPRHRILIPDWPAAVPRTGAVVDPDEWSRRVDLMSEEYAKLFPGVQLTGTTVKDAVEVSVKGAYQEDSVSREASLSGHRGFKRMLWDALAAALTGKAQRTSPEVFETMTAADGSLVGTITAADGSSVNMTVRFVSQADQQDLAGTAPSDPSTDKRELNDEDGSGPAAIGLAVGMSEASPAGLSDATEAEPAQAAFEVHMDRVDWIEMWRDPEGRLIVRILDRRWVVERGGRVRLAGDEDALKILHQSAHGSPGPADAVPTATLGMEKEEWMAVQRAIVEAFKDRLDLKAVPGSLEQGVVVLHLDSLAGEDALRSTRLRSMADAVLRFDPGTAVVLSGSDEAAEIFTDAFEAVRKPGNDKAPLFRDTDGLTGWQRATHIMSRSERGRLAQSMGSGDAPLRALVFEDVQAPGDTGTVPVQLFGPGFLAAQAISRLQDIGHDEPGFVKVYGFLAPYLGDAARGLGIEAFAAFVASNDLSHLSDFSFPAITRMRVSEALRAFALGARLARQSA